MMISLGLLVIRLVVGLSFAAHGLQKVGLFGGSGLAKFGQVLESTGVKPGYLMAILAAFGEIAGGLLFAAGVFVPFAAFLIVVTMIVAIVTVHGKNGFWLTKNGCEYNLVLIAIAIGVALTGPGEYVLF